MSDLRRVSEAVVRAVHGELLAWYGGVPGTRDDVALSAASRVPRDGKTSLFGLAAAYAAGIIKNHPFLDGNKRAGFMAAALFLEVNDIEFTAPEEEVVLQTLGLAAGRISERRYAAWLKASCKRRKARAR